MTAIMNNTSSYLDFFDIALDAYENKKIDVYRKIMTTLIASYKTLLHDIEIENNDLETVEHLTIDEWARNSDLALKSMIGMTYNPFTKTYKLEND